MPAVGALCVSLIYAVIAGCEPTLASRPGVAVPVAALALFFMGWQAIKDRSEA